jgi:hypothetical protein
VSVSGKVAGTLDLYDGTFVTSVEKYDLSPGGHINIKPKDQATLDFSDKVLWTGDLMLRGDLNFDHQIDASNQTAFLYQVGDAEVSGATLNFAFIWNADHVGYQTRWRNTGGDITVNMSFYGTAPAVASDTFDAYFRISDGTAAHNATVNFNMIDAPAWMNIGMVTDSNEQYHIYK